VSTAYLFPSTLQGLADVSVSPGVSQNGYPLVWNNSLGKWSTSLLPYSSLSGAPTLGTMAAQNANTISVTGGSASGLSSLAVSGTTASTNTTTGALTVAGGVGIGGAVNVAGAIKAGSGLATVAQLDITGGQFGSPIVRLNRTAGVTVSYSWSLSGGKLSFTNEDTGVIAGQMSIGKTIPNHAELNIGGDMPDSGPNPGTTGLIKGSDAGGTGVNVAGGDLVICSGRGRGSATPSQLFFQTPIAGSSGTTVQSRQTQLTISSTGITVAGNKINFANLPTSNAGLAVGDLWRDGENIKVKI
jgi:hypothetical protein